MNEAHHDIIGSMKTAIGEQTVPHATAAERELLHLTSTDRSLVLLDGFHAVKHAARFGADILLVVTTSLTKLNELTSSLAPDVLDSLLARLRVIETADIKGFAASRAHWTEVW